MGQINRCLNACREGDSSCRDECFQDNYKCIKDCPCFEHCPNGCPCWPDISNFCPSDDPGPNQCTENHKDEIQQCLNYCYNKDRDCVLKCNWNDKNCINQCYAEALECPKDCPCYENCPNGCPCGYKEYDCHDFNPNLPGVFEDDIVVEWVKNVRAKTWTPDQYLPRIIWCEDYPIMKPDENRHCNNFWAPWIACSSGVAILFLSWFLSNRFPC